MSRKIFFILFVSLSLVLAACSGDGGAASSDSGQAVAVDSGQTQGGQADQAPSDNGQAPSDGQDEQGQTDSTSPQASGNSSNPIVDTNQENCYDDSNSISCPSEGQAYYGQDSQYTSNAPAYVDNGDGTVSDSNTGLMWQQDPGEKTSYADAAVGADSFSLAGYSDWRLPSIKELYSLIDYNGTDVSRLDSTSGLSDLKPYLPDVFVFTYGDVSGGRAIDSQWTTSTLYVSTVMNGQECFFGANFADGRIKCYETVQRGGGNGYFTIYVRGDTYGVNDFADNGDGTISDNATGLMWMQDDNGTGISWSDSLAYCEDLSVSGYSDWRLPEIKQLQSIVDYTRSPDTSNSPALDSIFAATQITNEDGQIDWGYYWSSTSHLTYGHSGSFTATYIAFGRGLGFMNDEYLDVHGAGSQRSDPKTGDGTSTTSGPQGDVRRGLNFTRCVRSDDSTLSGNQGSPSDGSDDTGGQEPPPGDGGDGSGNPPPPGGGGGGNPPPPPSGGGNPPPPGGGGGGQP